MSGSLSMLRAAAMERAHQAARPLLLGGGGGSTSGVSTRTAPRKIAAPARKVGRARRAEPKARPGGSSRAVRPKVVEALNAAGGVGSRALDGELSVAEMHAIGPEAMRQYRLYERRLQA